MNDHASSGAGALRPGLIFGIIDAVIIVGTSLLGYLTPLMQGPLSIILNIASLGICLLLCGYAGYIAVKKSQLPASGSQAGFYVGSVSGLISGIFVLSLLYFTSEIVRRDVLVFSVGIVFMIGVFVVVGLVAGTIGGRLAQGRA